MAPPWVLEEMKNVDLNDQRLNNRLCEVLGPLSGQPTGSIPAACGRYAEMAGAYRLFDNEKVDFDNVLQPHVQATRQRMAAQPVVILVQDTTEIDLTRPHQPVVGTGPWDDGARRGMFLHPRHAFTPDGTPLGTVRAKVWTRADAPPLSKSRRGRRRKHTPIEQKESQRRIDTLRAVGVEAPAVPQTRWVTVADSFDMAGGTLAHHVARGDKVTIAIASTGVRSHHWKLYDAKVAGREQGDHEQKIKQAVEQKLNEVRGACRILGFDDVRDLGFDDDDIMPTREKVDAIAGVIRAVKPDVIITHHPMESGGFKMHGTIGQATLYAWQLAHGTGRGDEKPHRASVVYFMAPLSYIGNNSLEYAGTSRADLYIDVTDVIDKKVKAMDHISSQYYGGAYARKVAETSDGHFGQHANCGYAECFQRFRPMVRYTMPISDYDLGLVDESMESIMCRRGEVVGALLPLPAGARFDAGHRVSEVKYDK